MPNPSNVEEIIDAISTGDVTTVTASLNAYPDVDINARYRSKVRIRDRQCVFSQTLLSYAVSLGKKDILTVLIEHGADVDGHSAGNSTAMHIAAELGQLGCISTLHEAGADLNPKSTMGWFPIFRAIGYEQNDAVTLLASLGANLDQQLDNGNTPLALAVWRNATTTVDILIRHGADPMIANQENILPIDITPINCQDDPDYQNPIKQAASEINRALQAGNFKYIKDYLKRHIHWAYVPLNVAGENLLHLAPNHLKKAELQELVTLMIDKLDFESDIAAATYKNTGPSLAANCEKELNKMLETHSPSLLMHRKSTYNKLTHTPLEYFANRDPNWLKTFLTQETEEETTQVPDEDFKNDLIAITTTSEMNGQNKWIQPAFLGQCIAYSLLTGTHAEAKAHLETASHAVLDDKFIAAQANATLEHLLLNKPELSTETTPELQRTLYRLQQFSPALAPTEKDEPAMIAHLNVLRDNTARMILATQNTAWGSLPAETSTITTTTETNEIIEPAATVLYSNALSASSNASDSEEEKPVKTKGKAERKQSP